MDEAHWTHRLFVEHPDLFLAVHEAGVEHAPKQVAQLEGLLRKAGVGGTRLLDAPCGIGRHSVEFARRGWDVVGVEFVPEYVDRARTLAEERGVRDRATFVQGDLRHVGSLLKGEDPFPVILNLWTSLGYWDDATDLSILEQFHRLAMPGGVLLVETVNRDFVVKHFQATSFEGFGPVAYRESRRLDLLHSRVESEWAFYRKQGNDLRHALTLDVSVRLYSPHELRRLFGEAGWQKATFFGGWGLNPLSADEPRLLALARKETEGPGSGPAPPGGSEPPPAPGEA